MEMNGTTIIDRPVDVVSDYVMDLANDANIGRRQNQRDVEKLRDILESTP
jgi:hypothetical protein